MIHSINIERVQIMYTNPTTNIISEVKFPKLNIPNLDDSVTDLKMGCYILTDLVDKMNLLGLIGLKRSSLSFS